MTKALTEREEAKQLPWTPWTYPARAHDIDEEWTSSYMNSRPPRIVSNLNRDWTFNYDPSPQEATSIADVDFDDSQWPAIAVPHTWQTYETMLDLHPYNRSPSERDDGYWWHGWGYYRKRFSIDESQRDKKVFVEFDGVQKICRVYLNGKFIGDHQGGFQSFSFDLTDHVFWGSDSDNVLTVAVSNERKDPYSTPPMTAGNWNPYGGIYRDVRLVLKNKVYIPYQGNWRHEGGLFVTTPAVNERFSLVKVKAYVKNELSEAKHCDLILSILNRDKKVIAQDSIRHLLAKGKITEIIAPPIGVKNTKLWHPDHPYLYKVLCQVIVDDKEMDVFESPLGFRFFHWDYEDDTLWVNGEKINIKGCNRHQEYPWLGDAIPKWLTLEDMKDIRWGLGHNFMRTAHYTNDQLLYDFNDQFGIITVEEVPNIKRISFSKEVQEKNVREMIRRDRNHPSIFFWSMGNETHQAADSKWAVEEDTTRIIHARHARWAGDFVQHDDHNLDMENLLRVTIRGWFDKDDVPEGIDPEPSSGQHSGTDAWQHQAAMMPGISIRGLLGDNCVGWLYEDHGADREYKNGPLRHVNYKGWADMWRVPKYIYFLQQATYTQKPMVFVHPHFWRKQYMGLKKDIVVDSNCDEVELFINDKPLGKKYPLENEFPTVTFKDVPIRDGELKAVGRKDREKHEHAVVMPGKPVKIVLTAYADNMVADRSGLGIVTAYIMDVDGNFVFDASNPLVWHVNGPGKLVGAAEYKNYCDKHEAMEGTGYLIVPVSNVVRCTPQPGKITVRVTSTGLQAGEIVLESKPAADDSVAVINQPMLSDKGRKAVKRGATPWEKIAIRRVLKPIRKNHRLKGSKKDEFREAIAEFIKSRNRLNGRNSYSLTLLTDHLAEKLANRRGELIADDYNFFIEQFNVYCTLHAAIENAKLNLNVAERLKIRYADKILRENDQVNLQEELETIRHLPPNATKLPD